MTASESKPRRFDRDVDGILLLDKPVGLSSNQALQQVRALYRARKAGHAGSLDPLASGMLPVCFGQATKVCTALLDARKTYWFTARLGERTETGDAAGAVVERQPVPTLSAREVTAVLTQFLGVTEQTPPMYSALKHQGERLYALARRGVTVVRQARRIVIETIELERLSERELTVVVRCSKGTYVRALAEDIARRLGTVAHLIALRRLSVDPFGTRPMHTIESLRADPETERLRHLLPVDTALAHLPAVRLDGAAARRLTQGQAVAVDGMTVSDWVRIYGPNDQFLGLGQCVEPNRLQPRRLFVR